MSRERGPRSIAAVGLLAAGLVCAALSATASDKRGVFVDQVGAKSAAEKAGLLPGDMLVSWSGERAEKPVGGAVSNVFRWLDIDLNQSQIGPIRLRVKRNGALHDVELPLGDWGLEPRPGMPDAAWKAFLESRAAIAANDLEKATASMELAESLCQKKSAWEGAAWITWKSGSALAKAGRKAEAEEVYKRFCGFADRFGDPVSQWRSRRALSKFYSGIKEKAKAEAAAEEALELARNAGEPLDVAYCLHDVAALAFGRGDLSRAEGMYQEALASRKAEVPGTLLEAASCNNLGVALDGQGRFLEARPFFERSLVLKERWRPGSLDVALSLNNLAMVQQKGGDLEGAASTYRRSLDIKHRLAPGSEDEAVSLNNMSVLEQKLGDLPAAEKDLRKALGIYEAQDPDSLDTADAMQNLGLISLDRGDLASAEVCWKRAFAICEKAEPKGLQQARNENNLALLASLRDDFDQAERLYREALAIKERLAPDSLDVATTLFNLGGVAVERKDLASAQSFYQEALALREKLAPASMDVAEVLHNLGEMEGQRGNSTAQLDYYRRACDLFRAKVPGSLREAVAHSSLGECLRAQARAKEAEEHLRVALAIQRRLAPGSDDLAASCYSLGVLYRDDGRPTEALGYLREAVSALEAQRGKLGGGHLASERYSAKHAEVYRALVDLLVLEGRNDEAFEMMERFRARVLLEMLAERDLDLGRDAPEPLLRERRLLARAYDLAQQELADLDPGSQAEKVEAALKRLSEVRAKQADLEERCRRENPRVAALQYPQPVSLRESLSALPPGCLLLSYCTGPDRTVLFALLDGHLAVFKIEMTQEALSQEIRAFRRVVADPASKTAAGKMGQRLYAQLLSPAAGLIARSRSVLLCADGPLHALPFAPLQEMSGKFFGEGHAYARTPSMTVFAEERKHPLPGSWKVPLVAFGDPISGGEAKAPASKAAARESLGPLPFGRAEVEAICALAGKDAVCLVGPEATERRALGLDATVRCAHFACHGLADEARPLDSALVLAVGSPQEENGLLQAWEIFESLRIDAELVTLSACETALGREMGGEGLVGLTRAFQYAGARSVMASLWRVPDAGTAEFMKRFYGHLFAGALPAEALRRARSEMARGSKAYAHPAHWAGFELTGTTQ